MLRVAWKFIMSSSTPFPLLSLRFSRHSRVSLTLFSPSQAPKLAATSRARIGFRSSIRSSAQIHTQADVREDLVESNGGFSASSGTSHPWPEWSKLVESLRAWGYFDREMAAVSPEDDDGFAVFEDLPEEFVRAARACLCFARDRPDLLSSLSKKHIEVVVENGSAFLFKNGMNSTGRLRSFLHSNVTDVLEFESAKTVDVIRFLLSYACNPLIGSDRINHNNRELVEKSVRNLLNDLSHMIGTVRESGPSEPMPRQFSDRYGQSPRPFGQNIEMKRGDWICPKCSFMNFARNMKCLECNEARPKRQLTGREWECPQCNFFNYGRNTVCLRCDCKHPGETSFGVGHGSGSLYSQALIETNANTSDIGSRLAANDEKAERWFSKVSQMDGTSNLSSAGDDEDFPEIMPLRKGVNRFVVSTRKTPLERRLENAQYRRNLGNNGSPEDLGGSESDKTSETSISQSLDRILGRSSAVSETDKNAFEKTGNLSDTGTEPRFTSKYRQNLGSQRGDSGYVPFVPLPPDMFRKPKDSNTEEQVSDSDNAVSMKTDEISSGSIVRGSNAATSHDDLLTPKLENPTESDREKEQAEKSERWFKKVAELHDVTDLSSAISDEDFPEIMPMRKGENRFVVSKKKDRSLTSPQYKRRLAMEQSNSSNFVPFVPFPPGYFAKKDKEPETRISTEKAASENAATEQLPHVQGKSGNSDIGSVGTLPSKSDNPPTNNGQQSADFSANILDENKMDGANGGTPVSSTHKRDNLQTNAVEGWNSGFPGRDRDNSGGSSTQRFENTQNHQFTGKSLEGSLVKEPDPLDMSEEAKAQRWFRRVAQIKDISELSQIPDEDFPSIMPMRKGVNRFVVSKRKTPLERRLTSPQYRRNLPIVSSEPSEKKDTSS